MYIITWRHIMITSLRTHLTLKHRTLSVSDAHRRILPVLLALILSVSAVSFVQAQANPTGAFEFVTRIGNPDFGAVRMHLEGNRLYVANKFKGLQIVDISDMYRPKILSTTASVGQNWGIAKKDNYIYMADIKAGLLVYDVTNEKKPKKVSELEVKGEAWDVQIKGNYAYMAAGLGGLVVVDITDPLKPQVVTSLRYDREWDFARQLKIVENTLYLADRKSGIHIIDISNPTAPNELKRYATQFAEAVYPDNNKYAYIADGPGGMLILDVVDPIRPKKVAEFKMPGHANDVVKYGNYVYISLDDAGIRSVDVSNPARPKFDARYDTPGQAYNIIKQDVLLVVADLSSLLIMIHNKPPVIVKVGNKTVAENQTLEFRLRGSDPDGNAIEFSSYFMPEGAVLKDSIFTWVPSYEQSGKYEGIIFAATELTKTRLFGRDTISITVTNTNRPPALPITGNYTVDENKPLNFRINPPTDPDVEDAGKLKVSASGLPAGAVFNEDSLNFSWIPTYEQSGEYTVKFTVKDAEGATDFKESKIIVNHINRPPVFAALDPAMSVNENATLTFTVLANDPDKEDDGKLEYAAVNLFPGASFDKDTRTFSWTPSFEQSGKYSGLSFIVRDPDGLSDTVSTIITVNHVNRPPFMAAVNAQTVDEVKTLTFRVSASDPDVEDIGKITLKAISLPEGAVFDAAKGIFTWTPTYDQSGDYNATIEATDPSGATDNLSVAVKVNNINRPPTIAEIKPQVSDENVEFVFVVPEGIDPDKEDIGKLTYTAERLPQGASFDAATRTIRWLPNYDQSGVYDGIRITVKDVMGLTASATMKLTINHVNRPPVLDAIADQTVDENKPLLFTISGSDPDKEDAGKLIFSAENLPAGANFDPVSRRFTWTPTFEQSGIYDVKFVLTDPSKLSDSKTTRITVNHVNRLPKLPAIAAVTGDEEKDLSITIPAAEDPDKEDEGKLTYKVDGIPEGGSFDATSRVITWKPSYEQSGAYILKVTVSDPSGLSDSKNIDLRINNVNRPPVMSAIPSQTIDENQRLSFTINVSDPDKEDLNRLTVKAEGAPLGAVFTPMNRTFTWTPTFEQAGEYKVTFTVTDAAGLSDTKTATITVNNVNRKPTLAIIQNQRTSENKPLSLSLSATDPDKDDAANLTFSAEGLPEGATLSNDGKFAWTPNFDQAGTYTITFKAKDQGGMDDSKTITVIVDNVNRPPKLEAIENQKTQENKALAFKINATDEDKGDKVTFSMTGAPAGASLSADGNFAWTPTYDQAGTYTVNVRVADGALNSFDTKSFTITVDNVNRPPVLEVATSPKVDEGKPINFKVTFKDPDKEDAGKLTLTADGVPTGATFNALTGQFSWTPNFEQAGDYTVTFKVKDAAGLEDSKTVTITVNNVNRAPKLTVIGPKTVKEGAALTFKLSATDDDKDDALTYSMTNAPSGADLSSDGSFNWTPQSGQAGNYTVTFTVSDGKSSDSKNAVITVQKGSN